MSETPIPRAGGVRPAHPPSPAPGMRPAKRRPRLSVVQMVYHQQPDGQPTVQEARYSRWLESDEQPYLRRMTVGEEWVALDVGWVEKAGMLVLRNEGGPPSPVKLTPEQKAEAAAKVIEVGFTEGLTGQVWLIPPGESMAGVPRNAKELRVRCQSGEVKLSVCVLPA